MPFKEIMKSLVQAVPGAGGAILADWEGEAVENCCLYDDYALKVTAAHCGIVLQHMKEVHASLNVGSVKEVVLTTGTHLIIVGAVGSDYSLIMTLDRNESLVGYALYHFRKSVQILHREIY